MVTLQILVLSFLVRVRVSQLSTIRGEAFSSTSFFVPYIFIFGSKMETSVNLPKHKFGRKSVVLWQKFGRKSVNHKLCRKCTKYHGMIWSFQSMIRLFQIRTHYGNIQICFCLQKTAFWGRARNRSTSYPLNHSYSNSFCYGRTLSLECSIPPRALLAWLCI